MAFAISFHQSVLKAAVALESFALRFTKNEDGAKDLIQDTVLKALSNEDKFKPNTNIRAWMYTIMRNIYINQYRKKHKRKTTIETTDENYYLESTFKTYNQGPSKLVMDDVFQAIGNLSEKLQRPLIMTYEGYSQQEIAQDLQIPVGTVKSRIFLARKKLINELSDYYRNN